MKQILKYYCLLFILIFLSFNYIYAQGKDSLVELYPGLGNEIDRPDKEYYGLFNEYNHFDKAVFYIRDDKYLISKIKIFRHDISYDTVLIRSISSLDSMRFLIKNVEMANINSSEKTDAAVITRTGERYEGKLDMFSKKYLYFYSDKSITTGNTTHLGIKIPVSNVEAVVLPGQSNTLTGMDWGGLVGLLAGIAVSSSVKSQNFWIYDAKMMVAGFFALLGAGIGTLIGLGASTSDKVIEITSTYDLIKLKELVKYNPGDKIPPDVKYFTVESL